MEYMIYIGSGGRGNRVVRFEYADTYREAQAVARAIRTDSAPVIERWCPDCDDYHKTGRHRMAYTYSV